MAVMTSTGLPAYQLDADQYGQLVDTGALDGQRVELLDGIITQLAPQSFEHATVIERLTAYLVDIPSRSVEVRTAPAGDTYRALTAYGIGESVPAPLPGTSALAVDELFAGLD